jgi:hypothetical protein
MGIEIATESASARNKQTRSAATDYADAVAAINLPKHKNQQRLLRPTRRHPTEGQVITLKEEVEYDQALLRNERLGSREMAFATKEMDVRFDDAGTGNETPDASTSSVQVRALPVGRHDLRISAEIATEMTRGSFLLA